MSLEGPSRLPEQATRCLTCACANAANAAAAELLRQAGALTATGVIAAIFLAQSDLRWSLTEQARHAIAEQRQWCEVHGAWDASVCPIEWIRRGHPGDAQA
jgi:hypothetical protein